MISGWHITSKDIIHWTNTNHRQAQETLPHLVRKLIFASINPSLLSLPSGDNISLPGWDGILNTDQGNAFIPKGDSVWELSVDKNITRKANSDYRKRTNDPLGVDKSKNTYVSVTTRTWVKRDKWVREKNSERQWAQVKGINANDLETWLEQCPAVHRWFARIVGKRSEGALDVEQAWSNWSYATKPQCNEDLVIAGRQNKEKELVNKLKAGPSLIRILGESTEEAFAFVIAVTNSCIEFSSRLLVVYEPREWHILIDSQNPLILIPWFDSPHSFGLATQRGHYVILPVSNIQLSGRPADITLGKAEPNQQINALITMGLEDNTAKDIVHSSRGYLGPIRRHPELAPLDYQKPSWATSEHAEPLITVLLVGAWTADNENDCDKLAHLTNISYFDFEQLLNKWVITGDPPICRIGNVWQIVSRQDTWTLLSPFINARVLERFGEVVQEVLQEIDPRLELPPEERWMANVYGKVFRYSVLFRHGLAEMLAILASYGDRDCKNISTHSVQNLVSYWVRQLLLEKRALAISGKQWGSLVKELPLLAEAAPEIFMEAVEASLQDETPAIMELFVEEGDMGGCPHAGLLWALEGISWNLDYLPQAVRILAKLAQLDLGGRYTNRPANTLKEIFQGWLPQTKAPLNERLKIIDSLIRYEPEPIWKLLLDLLPPPSGFSTPIHRPYFRDWAKEWKKGVTYEEYNKHSVAIAERILKHVNERPNARWLDVLKSLSQLPKESLNTVIIQLTNIDLSTLTDAATNDLSNELRKTISRHREFSNAKWALPKEVVDKLDEVYQRFIPADLVTKYKFLFDNHIPALPDIPTRLDYEQKQKLIEQARLNALREIWNALKISGIERLATVVEFPWSIGNSLSNSSFVNDIEELVLCWLESKNNSKVQTAKAYVNARSRQSHEWLETIHRQYIGTWSDDIWSTFCLSLPFNKAVFDFLETLPKSVMENYWDNVRGYYLQDKDAEYANWVIEQLLIHDRPLAAINAASQNLHTIARETGLDTDLLARVLEYAAINPANHELIQVSVSYEISTVLKALQTSLDLDEKRLARIEWMYLQFFSRNDIQPVALMKEVIQNPSFFVHMICLMFKANPPIEGEFSDLPSELRKQRAMNARNLFDLVDTLPGQSDFGISVARMQEWIEKAREEYTKRNRRVIGDECIGELLSHSPIGSDGVWPHEAVREILERYESRDIERGLEVGLYNQRGVTLRVPGEGGKQERDLAKKYQQQAEKIKFTWSRTAAMLRRIANHYKYIATRFDREIELE